MDDGKEREEDSVVQRQFDFNDWRSEGESALESFSKQERELLQELDKVRRQKAELEEALGKKKAEPLRKAKSKKRIKPLLLEYLMLEGRSESGAIRPVSVDDLIDYVQTKQNGVVASSIELSITRLVRNHPNVKWVSHEGSNDKGLAYIEDTDETEESEQQDTE